MTNNIQNVDFDQAIEERYLAYALSTIMSRSLPDVRDGLKPVHRRLIYAMQQLKLDPHSPFKKCARIVGDVMGKFHPHGDAAIYGALVRLAQDFSVRYPLIEGQGNFGNIDGDGAAAMRYTEARLSAVATTMLEGLDQNCVDFRPTYDGEAEEPIVFPTFFPNLLANGASGIAVGMATSIPPHNAEEIFLALEHLIAHPNATLADVMKLLPGPDFPTGGLLMEDAAALEKAYSEGRGSLRLRARWHKEDLGYGTYKVVIDQIPYGVEKAKVVEKIASLILEKKNPFLEDVQDESTDDMRLVLYPKSKNVDADVLMESVFQQTDLDVRFALNMNVLDAQGVPRVMNLKEVLQQFLDHVFQVQQRQATYKVRQLQARQETLQGFLTVYLNLDRVIAIIRDSDDPKEDLKKEFRLTESQVESVLNMRLRSLRRLQEMEIRQELDVVEVQLKDLETLLGQESRQWQSLRVTFSRLRKQFGAETSFGARRTEICGKAAEVTLPQVTVEDEPLTVLCSAQNWVKAVKGHGDIGTVKYREGDGEKFQVSCSTRDRLLAFSSQGRVYNLEAHKIPVTKGPGESLRLTWGLSDSVDLVALVPLSQEEMANKELRFLVVSDAGMGFLVQASHLLAQTKNGRQVLNVKEGERALFFRKIVDEDALIMLGTNRKMVVLDLAEVPVLAQGRGVRLQRYKAGKLSDLTLCRQEQGLSWMRNGQKRTVTDLRPWLVKRGSLGRLPPPLFPRNNRFA